MIPEIRYASSLMSTLIMICEIILIFMWRGVRNKPFDKQNFVSCGHMYQEAIFHGPFSEGVVFKLIIKHIQGVSET